MWLPGTMTCSTQIRAARSDPVEPGPHCRRRGRRRRKDRWRSPQAHRGRPPCSPQVGEPSGRRGSPAARMTRPASSPCARPCGVGRWSRPRTRRCHVGSLRSSARSHRTSPCSVRVPPRCSRGLRRCGEPAGGPRRSRGSRPSRGRPGRRSADRAPRPGRRRIDRIGDPQPGGRAAVGQPGQSQGEHAVTAFTEQPGHRVPGPPTHPGPRYEDECLRPDAWHVHLSAIRPEHSEETERSFNFGGSIRTWSTALLRGQPMSLLAGDRSSAPRPDCSLSAASPGPAWPTWSPPRGCRPERCAAIFRVGATSCSRWSPDATAPATAHRRDPR